MKIPLKGGLEHDALSRWHNVIKFRAGERRAAKKSYAKRLRKWLSKLAADAMEK